MSIELTPKQDSIIILLTLGGVIEKYTQGIIRIGNKKQSLEATAYKSLVVLNLCSYLEEWEYFGSKLKSDDEVLMLRKICTPALKQLRKWKDLEFYSDS